jgi:hypothetical protein
VRMVHPAEGAALGDRLGKAARNSAPPSDSGGSS